MNTYDYYSALVADIEQYIKDNDITAENADYNELYDKLFVEDSVTGNASGSYTFNRYKAEEYLCHNLEIYVDACNEFEIEPVIKEAEQMDVTIGCYVLGSALEAVLDDMAITSEQMEVDCYVWYHHHHGSRWKLRW